MKTRQVSQSWQPLARPATLAAAVLVLALGLPRSALALDVIGNLNVDTTWHKSDSPVNLTGDVTVQGHVTLTIEPGTVIVAATTDALGSGTDATRVEFIVKGSLIADGTAANRIVIKGAAAGPTVWYGMSFEPGAHDSRISFLDLSDAEMGIYARTTNSLGLSDLTITNCTTGLLWKSTPGPTLTRVAIRQSVSYGAQIYDDGASGATATFSQSEISGTKGPGLQLTTRVSGAVDRCTLFGNYTGITNDAGAALSLTNSLIFGNTQGGLALNQSGSNVFRITNNTIDRNNASVGIATSAGTGIAVAGVSDASKFIIRNNNVTSHGTYGVQVTAMTSPSLDHNNVWGNGMNYSAGTSGGTGAVSANPLYREAYGAPVTGMAFSHLMYPNNDNWTFTCSDPTAGAVAASFTSFDTEMNFDFLKLYDASGALMQTLDGTLGAFLSNIVPGSSMLLHFTSDATGTRNGFAGNCVIYSTVNNYRLQSGSPAIDVGNNLDAPSTDFDNIMRPIDGDMDGTATVDIGAFEWHVNKSPVAKPGSDMLVLVNTAVNFDGSASFDPDGTVVSYQWDFADAGAMSSTAMASHTYTTLGSYMVKLTVTDDQGATGSATIKVTVTDNLPPVAKPGPDQKIMAGATASFDGSASYDPDGTVVSYDWDFGDATPKGSGRTVTHSYAADGVYTVTLTVTDNKGAMGSGSLTVTVGSGGPPDMAMSSDGGMAGGDGGMTSTDMAGASADLGMMGGGKDGGAGGDGGGGGTPDQAGPGNNLGPHYNNEAVGCGCRVADSGTSTADPRLALLCVLLLILARRRFGRRTPPRLL